MSVLNQSGDEPVECPLCMEHLEVDDLNFYPCTCGYQICRFCWHRIRTDENGLCPACRKAYPENPADFRPLTTAEVQRLKSEKRLRDQQRKQKVTESRQHLASVRVVQRNLVFVVGLPMRLADSEVLKKHEYFGKFGKIHKVVINQSTSYAGSQGPSASAYVTYQRAEDALRAIASVNNIAVDGRTLKASLGTTKYCSHFMKNQPCPKTECMYLHDLGDPEASFTKEDMQQGKHQEYEKKLHEQLVNNTACQIKEPNNNNNIKEAWPSLLQGDEDREEVEDESPPPPPLLQSKPARNSHKSESGGVTTAIVNGGGGAAAATNHKKRHTSGEEPRGRRRGRDKGSSSSSSSNSNTNNTSNNNNNANNNGGPGRGQQQQQVNGGRRGRSGAGQTQILSATSTEMVSDNCGRGEDSKCEDSPQSASPSSSTSSLSGSAPLAPPASRSLSTSSSSCSSASSVSEDAAVLSSNTQDALTDVQRRAAIFAAASGREESDNQSFFSSPYPFTTRPNLENSLEWDDPALVCVPPLSRQGSDDTPPAPTLVPAAATLPPSHAHILHNLPPPTSQSMLDTNQLPDWQSAFNFGSNHKPLPAMQSNRLGGSSQVEDELGFDPFAETQKALAELIETEQQQQQRIHMYQQQKHKLEPFPFPESRHLSHMHGNMGSVGPPMPQQQHHQQQQQQQQHYPLQLQSYRCTQDIMSCAASRLMDSFTAHCQNVPPAPSLSTSRPPPPPGFATSASNTSVGAYNLQHSASKILPFVNMQQPPPPPQQSQLSGGSNNSGAAGGNNMMRLPGLGMKEASSFSLSDWHAILPNLGAGSSPNYAHNNGSSSQHRIPRPTHKDNWQNDWTAMDPAIVTATPLMSVGMTNDSSGPSNHGSSLFPWVKSAETLSGHMYQPNNHNISSGWPVAAAAPPPGFSHPLHARGPAQVVERATIENL